MDLDSLGSFTHGIKWANRFLAVLQYLLIIFHYHNIKNVSMLFLGNFPSIIRHISERSRTFNENKYCIWQGLIIKSGHYKLYQKGVTLINRGWSWKIRGLDDVSPKLMSLPDRAARQRVSCLSFRTRQCKSANFCCVFLVTPVGLSSSSSCLDYCYDFCLDYFSEHLVLME